MADPYIIPRRLDDPELIGFWTIDEFAGMIVPFTWGILSQHIFIGIVVAFGAWFALRKAKAGRASSWVAHAAYWYLPAGFLGLRSTPPYGENSRCVPDMLEALVKPLEPDRRAP